MSDVITQCKAQVNLEAGQTAFPNISFVLRIPSAIVHTS
jgi:hypothetical protein